MAGANEGAGDAGWHTEGPLFGCRGMTTALCGFYRRPLFWCAVAAAGASMLASGPVIRPLPWLGVLVVGCGLVVYRWREVGLSLVAAGFYGLLAARAVQPAAEPGWHDGMALTVRGELLQVSRHGGRAVMRCRARLVPGGWAPASARIGLRVPTDALPGDVAEASGLLRRPPPATQPGGPSERLDWLRRGAGFVLEVRAGGYACLARPPRARRLSDALRERLAAWNRATLSPTSALIANSFLVGMTATPESGLARRVRAAFQDSGLIHLLVVSGSQVGLLLAGFVWLGRRFYGLRWLFWSAAFPTLGLFHVTTGGDPSVSRAALMGGIVMLGLLLERPPDLENSLGAAALVLLAVDPLVVHDPGAQLSFAAVWSLCRLAPPLYAALGPGEAPEGMPESLGRALHRSLAGVAAAAIAAHLATAPIIAYHFQRSSWWGIAGNLAVFPIASELMLASAAHAVLGLSGIAGAAPLVDASARGLYGWVQFFAGPPFGARNVFPPPAWLIPGCLAALAVPAALRVRTPAGPRWHRRAVLLWTGALAGILVLSETLPAPARETTVRALDIGQGDCLLLESGDGTRLLIDAGPADPVPGASSAVRALRALRVPRLDAAIVSHTHADHIGGLPQVLRSLPVGLLLCGPRPEPGETWNTVLREAVRRGVPVRTVAAGSRLTFRSTALTVLGPSPAAWTGDANDDSLVLRWDTPDGRVLLTGDAGLEAERRLLLWGDALRADVLKVGHHGSARATGEAWLSAVRPRLAVICCGRDNRFGFPDPATLARLQAAGARVARTDRGGMLTVRLRRGAVRWTSFLPAAEGAELRRPASRTASPAAGAG